MITPYQFTILQQLIRGGYVRSEIGWWNSYFLVEKENWPNSIKEAKISKKMLIF
jgi:hypothetical protein